IHRHFAPEKGWQLHQHHKEQQGAQGSPEKEPPSGCPRPGLRFRHPFILPAVLPPSRPRRRGRPVGTAPFLNIRPRLQGFPPDRNENMIPERCTDDRRRPTMGQSGAGAMRAELIMVGTELLLGQIVDSNAAYLAEQLAAIGINVYHKTTVGDNWTRIAAALGQAFNRADIIITSGGLGPTDDDLTKEVLAAVTGRGLVLHEEALAQLEAWFQRQGRTMPARNRKQVMLPEGARIIPNSWGTAPGVLLETGTHIAICLPGVPRELRGMMESFVVPYLRERAGGGAVIRSRTLRFCGIGESHLEERVRHLTRGSNPTVAPYAGTGEVKLRITARAANEEEAQRLIEPVQRE